MATDKDDEQGGTAIALTSLLQGIVAAANQANTISDLAAFQRIVDLGFVPGSEGAGNVLGGAASPHLGELNTIRLNVLQPGRDGRQVARQVKVPILSLLPCPSYLRVQTMEVDLSVQVAGHTFNPTPAGTANPIANPIGGAVPDLWVRMTELAGSVVAPEPPAAAAPAAAPGGAAAETGQAASDATRKAAANRFRRIFAKRQPVPPPAPTPSPAAVPPVAPNALDGTVTLNIHMSITETDMPGGWPHVLNLINHSLSVTDVAPPDPDDGAGNPPAPRPGRRTPGLDLS